MEPETKVKLCERCGTKKADAFTETLKDNGEWEVCETGRCKDCEDIVQHWDDVNFNRDLGI